MAFLVLVINTSDSVDQLNARVQPDSSQYHECMNRALDYLGGIVAKTPGAVVQVTTRDSDPSVSTSGADSKQVSLALN